MIKKKMIKPIDPQTLAYEYWSFAIFLFFECYVLRYDENFDSCMNIGLKKITKHTRFLLDAIKLDEKTK